LKSSKHSENYKVEEFLKLCDFKRSEAFVNNDNEQLFVIVFPWRLQLTKNHRVENDYLFLLSI